MPYIDIETKPSSKFQIDATGDCCVGDKVKFERAVFSGSYRNAKFAGTEIVFAKIIKDSYGEAKQQHTFTLIPIGTRGGAIKGAKPFRIKGRNLYKNGVFRAPWEDEDERITRLSEKHGRGKAAREARYQRRQFEYENSF